MSVKENAIAWMENLANDDSHGYDQQYRWGQRGDYDCSSAVITAWKTAGVNVSAATYTGNMYSVFKSKGFVDVTSSVNLNTGSGLKRGDVLLNKANHVAMYCGSGEEVEASINEFGGVTGGQPGDQTGYEVLIRPYRNYPWDCVLRYSESEQENNKIVVDSWFGPATAKALQTVMGTTVDGIISNQSEAMKKRLPNCQPAAWEFVPANKLKYGSSVIKAIQKMLGVDVDGFCGNMTVRAWQKQLGVTVDGYFGGKTVIALQKWINSKL